MAFATNLVNFIGGFGTGYQFNIAKSKEDEIRQGANHFMAAFPQVGQLGIIANLAGRMADKIATPFLRIPTKIFLNVAPLV